MIQPFCFIFARFHHKHLKTSKLYANQFISDLGRSFPERNQTSCFGTVQRLYVSLEIPEVIRSEDMGSIMLYEDIVRGVVNSTKSITFELMNNDDDNDAFFLKR